MSSGEGKKISLDIQSVLVSLGIDESKLRFDDAEEGQTQAENENDGEQEEA